MIGSNKNARRPIDPTELVNIAFPTPLITLVLVRLTGIKDVGKLLLEAYMPIEATDPSSTGKPPAATNSIGKTKVLLLH